jgi:hypothetical protein
MEVPEAYARLDRKTRLKVMCGQRWVSMGNQPCNGLIATIQEVGGSRVLHFPTGWVKHEEIWHLSPRAAKRLAQSRSPETPPTPSPWHYPTRARCSVCGGIRILDAGTLEVAVPATRERTA